MNSGHSAAEIAREAARGMQSTYFHALTRKMCWDAVAYCQGREEGKGVSVNDRQVMGPTDLHGIPEGASIGFFLGDDLLHEMIYVGNGQACGNKNDCIGIGNFIGWEQLDLTNGWHGDLFGPRAVTVHYRPI